MPAYKPWERRALAKKRNERPSIIRTCRYCGFNKNEHRSSYPRPCEPCFAHLTFDTGFKVQACSFGCGRRATRWFYNEYFFTADPYCGECKNQHGYRQPEQWEEYPWIEQRIGIRGYVDTISESPYCFLILPPSNLFFEQGWRVQAQRRDAKGEILREWSIPRTANHFSLWPEMASFANAR